MRVVAARVLAPIMLLHLLRCCFVRGCPWLSDVQAKHDTATAHQLQTLQQQLQAEQQARANAEQKMDFLKGKLKEVAERSKTRGNTLVQLVAAVKRLTDAKSALQQAEAEVLQVLAAADAYLQVSPGSACAAAIDTGCIIGTVFASWLSSEAQTSGGMAKLRQGQRLRTETAQWSCGLVVMPICSGKSFVLQQAVRLR